MHTRIQPSIQPLKNLHISVPMRSVMSNGITLNVIQAGSQEVVRIDILFAAGRWYQSQKLQALFTNRMLREGCAKYSAGEIAEKLDYYGSWLELSTSSEYAFLTVYSLNKYIAETLDIIESIVKEPLFPEEELNTILETNIQQYLVNSSKVDFLAQRSLLNGLYGFQHPCGQIVTEEDYRQISPDVLRSFYDKYYHSGNCSIFISGKVSDDTIRRVTDAFGTSFKIENKDSKTPQFKLIDYSTKRFFIERVDALQSAIRIGGRTISRHHPDYLKLRVLMTLFGGYFGCRLMSNIREEKGYTYGISAGIQCYPDSGLLLVSTDTANEYVEPLIQEIYHEMDVLCREPVGVEELAMVRNYMLGEMCRNYESPFSLADAWIFIATSGLDDDYFTRSLDAVNEVTPSDLQELANRYFCKETLKEVIAGKKLS